MRKILASVFVWAIACFGSYPVLAAAGDAGASASEKHEPRLTVIFDAFGSDAGLQKDWGYAALIEVGGKRILFDTGNDPGVLEHNVKAKGIDLTRLDFVVVSHRHSDHMGGLSYVLSVNPNVKIYAPEEAFGAFGSSLPSSFYRKDPNLPPEKRYYDGTPPNVMRFGSAWPKANLEAVTKTKEIVPGISLISLVSDKPGTLELRELSLAIETPQGLVVLVGCSHPGIDRIVEAATAIDKRIHLIAGGLHLAVAPDGEIDRLASVLHEQYHVGWIAPGHCTGEPAFAALEKRFGDRYLYAGLGTAIGLGVDPRRASLGLYSRHAMNSQDLGEYRKILRAKLIRFGGQSGR